MRKPEDVAARWYQVEELLRALGGVEKRAVIAT